MANTSEDKLLRYIGRLLEQAGYFNREYQHFNSKSVSVVEFVAGCRHLAQILGPNSEHWRRSLDPPSSTSEDSVHAMIGTLRALQTAIYDDLLMQVEDLVRGETFNDLLEQAEYLSEQGFNQAATVLGRAVLEEHLRNWCRRLNLTPSKVKATMADFNQALYAKKVYQTATMKHIESLAAIGNAGAHAQLVVQVDLERMLRDVRSFLANHPF